MLYFLPFIGAVLGWCMMHLTLKLLFYPKQALRLPGFTLMGFIPMKKDRLVRQIASWVATQFPLEELTGKIDVDAISAQVLPTVEGHVDVFIKHKLKEEIPLLSMFINDKTIGSIKGSLMSEVESMLPEMIGQMTGKLKESIDIEKMIVHKLDAMSVQQLEMQMAPALNKAGANIKLLGALMGFTIGCILLAIVLWQ